MEGGRDGGGGGTHSHPPFSFFFGLVFQPLLVLCELPHQCLATFSNSLKNVGKVLRVHPGSRMVTGTPHADTRLKAMAMRWSSYVSMDTPALTCEQ